MIQLFDLPELLTLKSCYSLHCDLELPPSQPFVDSVKRFGLFQPPVLMKRESSLHLVCGSRRITAMQLAGLNRGIACTVVKDKVPLELLSLILENQLLTGPLSPITSARFLVLAEQLVARKTVISLMKQFSIGPYQKFKNYAQLLELEAPLRLAVHKEQLCEKVAQKLLNLNQEDRHYFTELILRFSLNKNKQRKLLNLLQITVARQGGTFKRVLERDLSDLFSPESHENTPQAAAKLLSRLYEVSHPLSSEAERSFRNWTTRLKLPQRCELSHSPAFETDAITLSIRFDNRGHLEKVWPKIKHQVD